MINRKFEFTKEFSKKYKKLKGKELENLNKKINEILTIKDLNHYKNLSYELKYLKRVHVNTHFVILFYDIENKKIIFVDYDHHDRIYLK